MKWYLIFLCLALFKCQLWAGDASVARCQLAIANSAEVLNQFGDKARERADKLKEWLGLTAGSEYSAISTALDLLKEFPKLQSTKPENNSLSDIEWWRSRARSNLDELSTTEKKLRLGIAELSQIIKDESQLIGDARTAAKDLVLSGESQSQSEKYLALRMSSMTQIREGMVSSLALIPSLYSKLLNKADFTIPLLNMFQGDWMQISHDIFLGQDPITDGSGNEVTPRFEVQNLSQSGRSYTYIDRVTPSYYRLIQTHDLSLERQKRLGLQSTNERIRNFIYPESQWQNFQKVSKVYLSLLLNPESLIGEAIELFHYPKSSSPPSKFVVESIDKGSDKITLSHESGFKAEEKLENLVKKQLRIQLLQELQNQIKSDKPVLVLFGKYGDSLDATIVTSVSMTNEAIKVMKLGESFTEEKWHPVGEVAGIPLAMDSNFNPWITGPDRVTAGSGTMMDIRGLSQNQTSLGPVSVEMRHYGGGVSFWTENKKSQNKKTRPVYTTSKATAETPSLVQVFGKLCLDLEGPEFLLDRAFAIINTTRNRAQEFQEIIDEIKQRHDDIEALENPGFVAKMGLGQKERKIKYDFAVKRLLPDIQEAESVLQDKLTTRNESLRLIREIVPIVQRYQATIANVAVTGPYSGEKSNTMELFLKERLSLINEITQRILAEDQNLEAIKKQLRETILLGKSNVDRLQLATPSGERDGYRIISQKRSAKGATGILASMIYAKFDSRALLNHFFETDSATLTREFAPQLNDFKSTMAFASLEKQFKDLSSKLTNSDLIFKVPLNDGHETQYTIRKEAPDSYVIVNSASQSEEKFDYWGIQKWISQKRESFFFQEFNDFIAQHKVLYSPAMNVLILSYDPEVKRFNIVSKDGFLAGVGFGDLPVFMERYPNAVEVRTSRNETIQSIGLGTTFSGQSFHLSRGQNYYGDLLYYIEE